MIDNLAYVVREIVFIGDFTTCKRMGHFHEISIDGHVVIPFRSVYKVCVAITTAASIYYGR